MITQTKYIYFESALRVRLNETKGIHGSSPVYDPRAFDPHSAQRPKYGTFVIL